MKLARRERLILYFALALFSIMLLERFIFKPLSNRLTLLDREIEIQKMKLLKARATAGGKEQILKDYNDFGVYLKLKGSDEEVMSEFLKEIEKLARESSVSLSEIKPRSTENKGNFKEYAVEVHTEAAMSQIFDFLYRLDNSVLLLRVQKLSLKVRDETSDILRVTLLITGISLN